LLKRRREGDRIPAICGNRRRKPVSTRKFLEIRRTVAVLIAAFALLVPAGAAFADNCFNASRPSGGLSTDPVDFTSPVFKGRWLWLPSVGVPQAAWGFEVPENYLNGSVNDWLLANTPYCEEGGVLFYNGPRTTDHGIQSGCGAF
jgi:hypothetical protein